MSNTPSLKTAEISRKWYVVDASQNTLGRVSTVVAERLIGKHKPTFTPHIDNGDYVIVINADKLKVTGRKMDQKVYYRHSGYMGGLKEATLAEKMEKDSTEVIRKAVKGMIPTNKLEAGRLARLKVYAGSEHEHTAQKPEELGVK